MRKVYYKQWGAVNSLCGENNWLCPVYIYILFRNYGISILGFLRSTHHPNENMKKQWLFCFCFFQKKISFGILQYTVTRGEGVCIEDGYPYRVLGSFYDSSRLTPKFDLNPCLRASLLWYIKTPRLFPNFAKPIYVHSEEYCEQQTQLSSELNDKEQWMSHNVCVLARKAGS